MPTVYLTYLRAGGLRLSLRPLPLMPKKFGESTISFHRTYSLVGGGDGADLRFGFMHYQPRLSNS